MAKAVRCEITVSLARIIAPSRTMRLWAETGSTMALRSRVRLALVRRRDFLLGRTIAGRLPGCKQRFPRRRGSRLCGQHVGWHGRPGWRHLYFRRNRSYQPLSNNWKRRRSFSLDGHRSPGVGRWNLSCRRVAGTDRVGGFFEFGNRRPWSLGQICRVWRGRRNLCEFRNGRYDRVDHPWKSSNQLVQQRFPGIAGQRSLDCSTGERRRRFHCGACNNDGIEKRLSEQRCRGN